MIFATVFIQVLVVSNGGYTTLLPDDRDPCHLLTLACHLRIANGEKIQRILRRKGHLAQFTVKQTSMCTKRDSERRERKRERDQRDTERNTIIGKLKKIRKQETKQKSVRMRKEGQLESRERDSS